MVYEETGRVLAVNEAWMRLTGYSREDTPTLAEWFSKAQPDVPCPTPEELEDAFALSTAAPEGTQTVCARRGGALVCDFTSVCVGRSAAGARVVMRVGVDVTEQDNLRRLLEHTRMSLDTVIRSSPLAIIALDNNDNCMLWSPAAEQMFGFTEQEVLGRPLPTIPPEERARMARLRREVRTDHRSVQFEGERITKSGRRILTRATGAPLIDAQGRVQGVMAVFEDITERRRHEEQAYQSGQFLQAVLHAVPTAVVAIDPAGVVQLWNAAAERMFGWDEAEAVGRPLPIVPPQRREQYLRTLNTLTGGQQVPPSVRPCLRKDGSTIDVVLLTAPVFDSSGNLISLLGVMSPAAGGER